MEIQKALETLRDVHPRELQRRGYHFHPVHFYCALNPLEFLDRNRDVWQTDDPCAGIDWNHEAQLQTARSVGAFAHELRDIPEHGNERDPGQFYWRNNFWNNADAVVQYGLVRAIKPRRYVEIGCGWSSLLLARAVRANRTPTAVTLVEPYPRREIFATLPRDWAHHETVLQRVPLEVFEELRADDVCFYDGSHCVRTGSDVNWLFFRVLPRLASGVLIHLHDIFLPEAYPEQWIFDRVQSWNEQFLLQAFLMHNSAYQIVIANRYLWRREGRLLEGLYQDVQPAHGVSFWMRKK